MSREIITLDNSEHKQISLYLRYIGYVYTQLVKYDKEAWHTSAVLHTV